MEWNTFEIRDGQRTDTGTPVEGGDGWYVEIDRDGVRDVSGPFDTEDQARDYIEETGQPC